jgi:hypothetical protein
MFYVFKIEIRRIGKSHDIYVLVVKLEIDKPEIEGKSTFTFVESNLGNAQGTTFLFMGFKGLLIIP